MTSVKHEVWGRYWLYRACEKNPGLHAHKLERYRRILYGQTTAEALDIIEALTAHRFGVIRTVPGPSRPEQSE